MNAASILAGTTAVVTTISLPIVRSALLGLGVLDHATNRSSHVGATPRGGGLGVLVGAVVGVAAVFLGSDLKFDAPALAVAGAVILLAFTGFCDDIRSLGAGPRLLVQVVAGMWVGLASSGGHTAVVTVMAALAAAAMMVFIVNTVNFMDGINGITAATMIAWGAITWWAGATEGLPLAVASGAVAVGTAAGFLPFNVPRAALFLGDVGSYLYGALVAGTSVAMLAAHVSPLVVTAPLIPYIADVLATLTRRGLRGERLTEPHREHLYQLMTQTGRLSHWVVAGLYGLMSFACGAMALQMEPAIALVGCAIIALLIVLGSAPIQRTRATSGERQ